MERLANLLFSPFLCLLYLVIGALFVVMTGAIAWRRLPSSFRSVWGSRSGSMAAGTVPHKPAFLSALAASVGVGNLAGVATALHLGGPGALFWMWVSALFGMSFRMSSAYFAVKYRSRPGHPAFATPMAYLERVSSTGWLPKTVAAVLLVQGLINANLIQSNSVAHALSNDLRISNATVAIGMTVAVGVVILGGLRSIIRFSTAITPWMLAAYVVIGTGILAADPTATFDSLRSVISGAFSPSSAAGGVAGYGVLRSLQYGISRGIFSHGSGIGATPFFQAANDEPAASAYMAAAVPVIDTLVTCSITGLVILSKGLWEVWTGAHLTVSAFEAGAGIPGKTVVFGCLFVFAFTTVISWAHFSERCFEYLGGKNLAAYRFGFCAVTFAGPFFPVVLVWSLGDVLIGLLLLVHLLPLTYIVMQELPEMRADLDPSDIYIAEGAP